MARPTKATMQARRAEAEKPAAESPRQPRPSRPQWRDAFAPQVDDEPAFDATLPFDPLLSIDQVAHWLGKTPAALHQWRRRGQGPRSLLVGATVRYDRSDVYAWLAAQKRGQRASA